jgi:MFS transporter, BCD family, chlorophyll transporter
MFAVAAIGSMMRWPAKGRGAREGTRMGLWGASAGDCRGFGGLLGAALVDLLRTVLPDARPSAWSFLFEAGLFLAPPA